MPVPRRNPRAGGADAALAGELRGVLAALRRRHDHHGWWPARTRFELMAGAVLVQRARWPAAAAAARRLRRAGLLHPGPMRAAGAARLAAHVQPCGDHRTKARRLAALAAFVVRAGGTRALAARPTAELRAALLAVPGIGPETADVILLYGYCRPVFVADAYALRLFARTGFLRRARLAPRYAPVHARVARLLGGRTRALADLHAVIVEHGKAFCGAQPRCGACFLARRCDTGRRFRAGNRRPGR